jgi:hypothetical protein
MFDGSTIALHDPDTEEALVPSAVRERRAAPRRRLFEQARFSTAHSHPVSCILTSRSDGGLQLHSRETRPEGAELTVYLDGEAGEQLRGVVVWARPQRSMEDPPAAMGLRLVRGAASVSLAGGSPAEAPSPGPRLRRAVDPIPVVPAPPVSSEAELEARVTELEGFLRRSSQQLTSLVDGVLRAWTQDALERELEQAAAPEPTGRAAPDRLLRRAREVHDRLYDRLQVLDRADLLKAPDLDPAKARALGDGITSLQQDVFLGLSEVIYRLDRLVDDKPQASPIDRASLRGAERRARETLEASLPTYDEICRTPAFVHDADPRLAALRSIPRHPMQAVDLGADLERTVHDVLDPLLGILQDAVSANLHALLSHDQAGLTTLLGRHRALSAARGARDGAFADWQRDLEWCAGRLRELRDRHRRVGARFQAMRRAALTGDLSRGTLALLRHLGHTHRETSQALDELVELVGEGSARRR